MKCHVNIFLIAVVAAFGFSGTPNVDYDRAGLIAIRLINPETIKSSLVFLASDSLQGRETTEPGQRMAASFISSKFKSLGLKPLGDDGTYLQHFDVNVHYISDSSCLSVNGMNFWYNKDMTIMPFGAADTVVNRSIVFAGFGFESDSYSDYGNIDASNKIVMILSGNPRFADSTDIFVKSELYKRTNAMKHGAAAVIIAVQGGEKSFTELRRKSNSFFGAKTMSLATREAAAAKGMQVVMIDESAANSLLADLHQTVTQISRRIDSTGSPSAFDLTNGRISVIIKSEMRVTENVVGAIEGSDPALRDQYVVYSAHYDHLGKTADGLIFHGADDNASGTSTVLGIAEAYAKSAVKPRRSIIFLTVTGEEKGLLGSSYFVAHPVVPLKSIAADLNTDMDGRIDSVHFNTDSNYVYVIGSRKISYHLDSLMIAADSASEKMTLEYTYDSDNDPNQFYYRSDQYNFAKNKIPIIFFFSGDHPDYHKPTDTSDKIDYPVLARRASLIFLTGWKVANFESGLRPN
ncbi:MAG TPA: M28 family peptidase [Candidatus Kryptonia bacterium]